MIGLAVAGALASITADDPASECRVPTPEQLASTESWRDYPDVVERRERLTAAFSDIVIPEGPWRSPPADASVVFRTIAPPGGGYRNTIWTVVWREADGSWWFWKQDRDPNRRYILQMTPEQFAAMPEAERWPPVAGRVSAAQSAALDAGLADPCREVSGPYWPGEVPYVPPPAPPRPPGAPPLPPPPPPPPIVPDTTYVHLQMTEAGQEPRFLGSWSTGHGNALVSAAAWPSAD